MNLQENINRIREMMGLLNENNQNLINESVEGKRCWYYKKMAERGFETNPSKIPNLYEGAFQVQRFLNYIGYDIPKDYAFGDKTASALGTWAYGAAEGINTVDKLWKRMKKGRWDVGETTGYGPKMVKAVADMIIQMCKSLSKNCKVDQQTPFDMEFEILPQEETDCRNNLDKQFERAVKYWKNYLSTNEFKERIKNKNPLVDNRDIFGKIYDKIFNYYWGTEEQNRYPLESVINHYKRELSSIDGWKFVKNVKYNMMSSNPISVNQDVFCNKNSYEKAYYTFVHEIQHILTDFIPINDWDEVKKAYPLTTDHYANEKTKTKSELGKKEIPKESKNELISNGINYEKLIKWASDESWINSYWCDRNEKLSNLQNFRAYLVEKNEMKIGGNISVNVFTKYLKKYINNSEDEDLSYTTNFEELIVCWAQNNFTPQLSVFISELNSLAKEEGNVEKDYKDPKNINKGTTT